MAQTVKNLPATLVTQVQPVGLEDPLEKGMATNSSILAWRTPWTEEPDRLQSMGPQRVGHNWATNTHTATEYLAVSVYVEYNMHFKYSATKALWMKNVQILY